MSHRYRIRFAKGGDLVWVSHRDFLKVLERAARVADLPLRWTQGFNPRPHIHVALSLAVGIAGDAEVLEVGCAAPTAGADLVARWQAALPAGVALGAVSEPPGPAAAQAVGAHYAITWDVPPVGDLAARVAALLRARTAPVERTLAKGTRTVDVRYWLESCTAPDARTVRCGLRVDDGTARPDEVLRAMGLDAEAVQAAELRRTWLRLKDEPHLPPHPSS